MNQTERKLLTVQEYVALLQKRGIRTNVKPRSFALYIYNLIKEEGFPSHTKPRGFLGDYRIFIDPAEADAWIEARSKKMTEEA